MSDNGDQVRPEQWTEEPGDRLSRLAEAAHGGMKAHPEYGDDVRGIIALNDSNGARSAMWGYEKYGPEPVYDLIRASSHLFASLGLELVLTVDTGPSKERKTFEVPHPPLAGDGPHEKVELTMIAAGDGRLKQIGHAVRDAMESAGGDWSIDKLVIMIRLKDEGSSAILFHGIKGEHELAHHLLNAFQQVVESEGGQIVLIPLGGSPN
jgi:hypothetical protein